MPIVVYGISHKTADLSAREHLSFSLEDIPQVLFDLRSALPDVKEAMVLSTCQRTECYFYINQPFLDLSCLTGAIASKFAAWKAHAYTLYGKEALTHMMQVANGLDSSLLGEPQILGQIKTAYTSAKAFGFLGKHLEQVMQFIFATAKKIRHQTAIGQGAISLPYTAVSLGKCIFSEIANPYVLLIGAGSVIQNILNHLVKKKHLTVVIANRSFNKAVKLADKYGVTAIQMETVYQHLALADIVISATSSPSLMLHYHEVERVLAARTDRLIFMMDMAVPRDIAPEVVNLNSVFLYNIDDLHKIIQKHLDARLNAASEAENMIKTQVEVLMQKMQLNQFGSMIRTFRNQFGLFRQQLLESALLQLQQDACAKTVISEVLLALEKWALSSLGTAISGDSALRGEALAKAFHQLSIGKSPDQVLSEATRCFVNQLLHKPTLHFKRIGQAHLSEEPCSL